MTFMENFLRLLTAVIAIGLMARSASANILFLDHFDSSLDADHSQYGEPKAIADSLRLSKDGDGYPFEGSKPCRALDAGYSSASDKKAVVHFSQVNIQSARGTIEMWVKTAWSADPPQTIKENRRSTRSSPTSQSC